MSGKNYFYVFCIFSIYLCEISFSHKINNIQFQLLSMERIAEEMYQKKSKHTEEMLNKTWNSKIIIQIPNNNFRLDCSEEMNIKLH